MVLGGKLGFCGDLGVSTPFLTTCCIKNNNQTFVRKSNITWESANQNHHFETFDFDLVFCLLFDCNFYATRGLDHTLTRTDLTRTDPYPDLLGHNLHLDTPLTDIYQHLPAWVAINLVFGTLSCRWTLLRTCTYDITFDICQHKLPLTWLFGTFSCRRTFLSTCTPEH